MANSNPAFRNPAFQNGYVPPVPTPTSQQLQEQYNLPSAPPRPPEVAPGEAMTYEDTIMKTVIGFAVLLVGAAIGWFIPALAIVGGIVGFVLAMVNIFKKLPSPPLILAYAAAQGLLVGGISSFYAGWYDGIVPIALFGTLGVVGVTLALFANGKVRASKRATKIFLVAIIGYAAFSLVNLVLMLTGVTQSMNGLRDVSIPGTNIPMGIPLGILVVLLAAYSLVLDFDSIQQGVQNRAPRIYGWAGAFGIIVTVVWLYLEILRLVSYFLPRN